MVVVTREMTDGLAEAWSKRDWRSFFSNPDEDQDFQGFPPECPYMQPYTTLAFILHVKPEMNLLTLSTLVHDEETTLIKGH